MHGYFNLSLTRIRMHRQIGLFGLARTDALLQGRPRIAAPEDHCIYIRLL